MKNIFGYIYKITNMVNGKVYIGQTTYTPPKKRWYAHKYSFKRVDTYLSRAVRKHGEENFSFEPIMACYSREQLDYAEDFAIISHKATTREHGYNLKLGLGGRKHSEETKKKMSKTRTNNPALYEKHRGRKTSEETKKKMSETHKKLGTKPPRHSAEKLSEWAKGRPGHWTGKLRTTKRSRPCMVNGFIYPSPTFAARQEGVSVTTLRSWLSGTKTTKLTCEYI